MPPALVRRGGVTERTENVLRHAARPESLEKIFREPDRKVKPLFWDCQYPEQENAWQNKPKSASEELARAVSICTFLTMTSTSDASHRACAVAEYFIPRENRNAPACTAPT
jgi:hypothetical protein